MAKIATNACKACSDLENLAPDFVQNGVTDDVCASLANDTGFNPDNKRTDCDDLKAANECMIGGLVDDIERYDTCDWKCYMYKLVPNIFEMFAATICAICGLWVNIHELWKEIEKIWAEINRIWKSINNLADRLKKAECLIDVLYKGTKVKIEEKKTAGSYIAAGQGVSFSQTGGTWNSNEVSFETFGGLACIQGSCIIHHNDFTDAIAVTNFDNGTVERVSKSRKGNPEWAKTEKPRYLDELMFEIRINTNVYPIKRVWGGRGQESINGSFHVRCEVFYPGQYACGQHGQCNSETGQGGSIGGLRTSGGHKVPGGWIYVQVRMTYQNWHFNNNDQYTPKLWCGVEFDQSKISC